MVGYMTLKQFLMAIAVACFFAVGIINIMENSYRNGMASILLAVVNYLLLF